MRPADSAQPNLPRQAGEHNDLRQIVQNRRMFRRLDQAAYADWRRPVDMGIIRTHPAAKIPNPDSPRGKVLLLPNWRALITPFLS